MGMMVREGLVWSCLSFFFFFLTRARTPQELSSISPLLLACFFVRCMVFPPAVLLLTYTITHTFTHALDDNEEGVGSQVMSPQQQVASYREARPSPQDTHTHHASIMHPSCSPAIIINHKDIHSPPHPLTTSHLHPPTDTDDHEDHQELPPAGGGCCGGRCGRCCCCRYTHTHTLLCPSFPLPCLCHP